MNIWEIPDSELCYDLAETIIDIQLCKVALALGQTTYGDGKSIQDRLEANERIKATIEVEQERRGIKP